jgi:hypothetical protein
MRNLIHGLLGRKRTPKSRRGGRDRLLQSMPKQSVCAEIGVHLGDFSEKILRVVEPKKLHLIDPWKYETETTYKTSLYGGHKGGDQQNMDRRYEQVVARFRTQLDQGRVVFHRAYSSDAAPDFADGELDWVYIDGNHLYEFVKKDLELYGPKVKPGGFITGDDYDYSGWWQGGVKRAVDELVASGAVKLVDILDGQFVVQKVH